MKITHFIISASFILFSYNCASRMYVDTTQNWQNIATLENAEIFVDTTSIKREGNLLVAKEKKVFTTQESKDEYLAKIKSRYEKLGNPDKIEKWADYSYTTYSSEYDCVNSRFRVLFVEDFDSKGVRIVKSLPSKTEERWRNVDPETVADYTFFYVCDYLD